MAEDSILTCPVCGSPWYIYGDINIARVNEMPIYIPCAHPGHYNDPKGNTMSDENVPEEPELEELPASPVGELIPDPELEALLDAEEAAIEEAKPKKVELVDGNWFCRDRKNWVLVSVGTSMSFVRSDTGVEDMFSNIEIVLYDAADGPRPWEKPWDDIEIIQYFDAPRRMSISDYFGDIPSYEPDAANMRVVRYIVDPAWLREHGYDA